MADDVFVEDCGVAAGGLEVEVAEQRRADVDGQVAVDQFGGEDVPSAPQSPCSIFGVW
ncbi:hypothetical protein [Actinomadura sp. KC06]|uniref:hypothetical protein n=1 Tax=Actinomadura sp. KC06 TaxID=2530369 RepID=UPI001FB59600|nr:hypothetical protein [Actinomadura sp. KC06]